MKTYAEWLEEFRKILLDEYEKNRIDREICSWQEEVERPRIAFPRAPRSPFTLQGIDPESELPETEEYTTQALVVYQLGIRYNVEDWARDPQYHHLSLLIEDIGESIAMKEALVILKNLSDNSRVAIEPSDQGMASKANINAAEAALRDGDFTPDTMVTNFPQVFKFRDDVDFHPAWRLRGIEEQTAHLAGFYGGLNVYRTLTLKNTTLIFDKSGVGVSRTPIKVEFDNVDAPRTLIVDCRCSAACLYGGNVARIGSGL